MTRSTPTVRDDILTFQQDEKMISIAVESAQWFAWLAKETSTTFFFSSADSSYTAHKEQVGNGRGGHYWKAYRKYQGILYRVYLGKSENLTLTCLEECAHTLATRIQTSKEKQAISQNPISSPLLETKMHPPQLSSLLVERKHLHEQLERSLTHKLTLLLAPAGSGKTTLVNQWLSVRDQKPALPALAWVSLDAGDNDLLRFWRYVMTSCQHLLGSDHEQAAALLAPSASPIDIALTYLLNDLAELTSDALLVLDDYHLITEPRIHETLIFFIDHLPGNIHVLLLSRAVPPLPLLRWRSRGDLFELHGADLRFSLRETGVFLQQTLPNPLSEAALLQLNASLEGWIAGLRLLSLTLARWKTPHFIEQTLLSLSKHATHSSPHRVLLDYFVTEILETQPEAVQRFLLQTSMLSRLSAPLCDTVMESRESDLLLKTIEQAGLFLEVLEGPGEWYRYHTLFAEAMRREALFRLGEEPLRQLSIRASIWYEQEGFLVEAIESASQAPDMERMARLMEEVDKRNYYEPQTMLRWLDQLPKEILAQHPTLCLLFANELRFPLEIVLAQSTLPRIDLTPVPEVRNARIEELLQMAERSWEQAGEEVWIGAIWAFRALCGLINEEPFTDVVYYAQQGLLRLPEEKARDARLQIWRGGCQLFVGMGKLHQGLLEEAQALFLPLNKNPLLVYNQYLITAIRSVSGKCAFLMGDLQQAKQYQLQVLAISRDLNDEEMVADSLFALASIAYEWHDLESAEEQLAEAQEVATRLQPQKRELLFEATLQSALLQHTKGETTLALTILSNLLEKLPHDENSPTLFRIRIWQARFQIMMGDLHVQDRLPPPSQDITYPSIAEYLATEMLRGQLWLAQKKTEDALQHFLSLLDLARTRLYFVAALEIQILIAECYRESQREQEARKVLLDMLSRAYPQGFIQLFLNSGKPLLYLLRSLLPTIRVDAIRTYVLKILQAEEQRERSPLPTQQTLIEALSLQEQRVLQLLSAGWRNQDIAAELIVSINTVKYHIKNIYQKLGVSNRLQASEAARSFVFEDLS